jgi:hypothetical protein
MSKPEMEKTESVNPGAPELRKRGFATAPLKKVLLSR